MNKYLFVDAISCLDSRLIEEYILLRQKFKTNKIIKKKIKKLKRAITAACIPNFLLSAIFINNVFNYITSKELILFSAIGHFSTLLLICGLVTFIVGFIAFALGRRIIKKKFKNYDML